MKALFNEFKELYHSSKFENVRQLIEYINSGKRIIDIPDIKSSTKHGRYNHYMEKGDRKYTFMWSKYYSVNMAIEDIIRATQVLNNIEIEGVYNTPSLIKKLNEPSNYKSLTEKLSDAEIKRDIQVSSKDMDTIRKPEIR